MKTEEIIELFRRSNPLPMNMKAWNAGAQESSPLCWAMPSGVILKIL